MKHSFFLTGFLALSALLVAPYAEAQEQAGHPRTVRKTKTKRKARSIKKKTVQTKRPELPQAGSLVGMEASPDAHPEQYKLFAEKLKTQVKSNSADACEAMAVALAATGSEFCMDA